MTKWIILAVLALTVAAAGAHLWAASTATSACPRMQMKGCGGERCCGAAQAQSADDQATCPVMGRTMNKANMTTYVYQGTTYYFCCPDCVDAFKANPDKYLKPAPAASAPAPTQSAAPAASDAGAYYTCPMHPEVHLDKPGSCPKCGMALVKHQAEASPTQ